MKKLVKTALFYVVAIPASVLLMLLSLLEDFYEWFGKRCQQFENWARK